MNKSSEQKENHDEHPREDSTRQGLGAAWAPFARTGVTECL